MELDFDALVGLDVKDQPVGLAGPGARTDVPRNCACGIAFLNSTTISVPRFQSAFPERRRIRFFPPPIVDVQPGRCVGLGFRVRESRPSHTAVAGFEVFPARRPTCGPYWPRTTNLATSSGV